MPITLLVLVVFSYLTLLFWIASRGHKQQFLKNAWPQKPIVYALALGVYCTSWTFYGLVGTAAQNLLSFVPILLGPLLLFIFGQPLLRRVAALCRQENVRSIADFMASRYGKRRGIATSVTLIVFLATVPYIALQIKAVTDTFLLMADTKQFNAEEMGLVTSVAMISFALLFGIKRLDVSGYHSGLMSVIAFESLVKLTALLAVASFALYCGASELNLRDIRSLVPPTSPEYLTLKFWVQTAIAAAAIFCLPRMFHVAFVENLSDRHLQVARFVFPTYLALIAACIAVIAIVGNSHFAGTQTALSAADNYVLALPLDFNQYGLTLLGFIGGFSAATAMIIVATVTLSHMLSNDVILPLLIRRHQAKKPGSLVDYSRSLMMTRRITVVVVVALAYLYQRVLAGNAALTDIGLIAFALVVQLFPAFIFGLYSEQGTSRATYAGLTLGCGLWFVTLMLPLLAQSGALSEDLVSEGLLGITSLRPEYLFGFEFSDPYTRGVLISLGGNTLVYWVFTWFGRAELADRLQAKAFVNQNRAQSFSDSKNSVIALNDLQVLLTQFLGESSTAKLITRYHDFKRGQEVAPSLMDAAEHALAGVIGVASARAMLLSVASGKFLAVEDVVNMFEETARALRFNQDMIVASFETISSAISVVNPGLQLVSWNKCYEEMFDYPSGLLRIGVAVEDLIRFNAERGLLGEGSLEDLVSRRLTHLRTGKPYRVVRNHAKSVIEIKGSPLPEGGYLTTYDDITEFIDAQEKLEKANLYLEQRVKERTEDLELAQCQAEEANRAKSRFLALASHDILQPINAASLYIGVLLESVKQRDPQSYDTVLHLRSAIQSTESIISTLMEIAKLDTGAIKTEVEVISLNSLLQSLVGEYRLQLRQGVELHYVPTSLFIETDLRYLRRILQNMLSNAVKFTQRGKILVGCRKRGESVEVQVCDTGPGIHIQEQEAIFGDFYRSANQSEVEGLGLGLAVAARFSRLLGHDLACKSVLGRGSCFSVRVPIANHPRSKNPPIVVEYEFTSSLLDGCLIYYIDDDETNIHAMQSLLQRWGCKVMGEHSIELALEQAINGSRPSPDVLLIDYQLEHQLDGIALANQLCKIWGKKVPTCLVSASQDSELAALVASHQLEFIRKPIKPGRLRAVLEQLVQRAQIIR